jgi:glycosyltransferase involved in cell wall biosynthesis
MSIPSAAFESFCMERRKVVHLTSAHPRDDIRILYKQCQSLALAEYEVHLVVADGLGDETSGGVYIHDVGRLQGRLRRMLQTTQKVFKLAIVLDGDIFHLHDPELIPVGLKLKKLGKKVIFDAHEDVPKQILSKPYLNKALRWMLSRFFSIYESWACSHFDGVITATPFIREKFLKINPKTTDINNFPLLKELGNDATWDSKGPEVCYVGGISQIRGIREICKAIELSSSGARLNLCGSFESSNLEAAVLRMPGWRRVSAYGHVSRQGVRDILSRSIAGLVTLHPTINYLDALPVKLFEYMGAGIPVIASDFPLWRSIVADSNCGLLVNPLNPQEIADAIDFLITHPQEAMQMGSNGRRAVLECYNWTFESKKLLAFYENLF